MQQTLGGLHPDISTKHRVMNITIARAPGFLPGALLQRERSLHHCPVALAPEENKGQETRGAPNKDLVHAHSVVSSSTLALQGLGVKCVTQQNCH